MNERQHRSKHNLDVTLRLHRRASNHVDIVACASHRMATFIDAGKVASDWRDVRPTSLERGYGFGVRVHSNKQTFARVDLATGGGEGWKLS